MKKNVLISGLIGLIFGLIFLLINKKIIYIDLNTNLEFYALIVTLITLTITAIYNYKSNKNTEKQLSQAKDQFDKQQVKAEDHLNQQLSSAEVQFKEQLFIAKNQFAEQQKFLLRQQFESTFFNMMNQLEDIVSKLTLEKKVTFEHTDVATMTYQDLSENKTGRDVFQSFYERSRIRICDPSFLLKIRRIVEVEERMINNKCNIEYLSEYLENGSQVALEVDCGIKQIVSNIGMKGYEIADNIHILDHYFRYLYRIMKFVDESDYLENDKKYIDERYKYMGILRATLSPYELIFLFYNDLSIYGREKVKPLIEKYSMFKSLRKELLANSIRKYNIDLFNDNYSNDFDRFIAFDEKDNGYLRYNQSAVNKEHNKHLLNK